MPKAKAKKQEIEVVIDVETTGLDYTREKKHEIIRDEESLILFYTPVGLEIGYNHPNGWVTATLKDYQRFLKKL